jgi:hypothetical protein
MSATKQLAWETQTRHKLRIKTDDNDVVSFKVWLHCGGWICESEVEVHDPNEDIAHLIRCLIHREMPCSGQISIPTEEGDVQIVVEDESDLDGLEIERQKYETKRIPVNA